MAKKELGTKRICQECGAKFYDLNKDPAICPKCETPFRPEVVAKTPAKAAQDDKPETVEPDAATADDAPDDDTGVNVDDPEGLDAEEEEAKALSLDNDEPVILDSGDDDEDGEPKVSPSVLPEGFTEEGVEDDTVVVDDSIEAIDIDDDEPPAG